MPPHDKVFHNCLMTDGTPVMLAVTNGVIAAVLGAHDPVPDAVEKVDLAGAMISPGFVEGHIHLDTSFYGDTWRPHKPCTGTFDVHERVAFQAENLAAAAPMLERARNQLELCMSQGTTHMRSHVMVDGSVGLSALETILELRSQYVGRIDLQLVAFPQNGIQSSPGTPDLLDQAIGMGCDLVGGIDPATFDRNIEAHLDVVFGIAEKRGVDVDIHLHDMGTLGAFEIEQIAARARALGMQGHVAVSHAYCLGELSQDKQKAMADMLAESGIAIMTNAPGIHPFPPVALLREAGVTVFSGSDNIRDSWWPYGDGDMLSRANIIGYNSGFFEDHELHAAMDIVTNGGAQALRMNYYGVKEGCKADFVTISAQHAPEAVVAIPKCRDTYKGGILIATKGVVL